MKWFRLKFKRGIRSRRHQARRWLGKHPRVAAALDRLGCLQVSRETIARGVAAGLFVGLTPTVGAQVFLMVLICWSFRANFPAAFAASWVCNPLTMAPLYLAYHEIGEAILASYSGPLLYHFGTSSELLETVMFMFLGSLFLAIPAALVGYLLTVRLMREQATRRRTRSKARLTPPVSSPQLR